MNENHVYDMIIVGGGPGGYTSALYAARAGFDTIVLEKLSAGGQMSLTWQIDNYPGFENGIDGFSLAEKMQKQAEKFGAKIYHDQLMKTENIEFRWNNTVNELIYGERLTGVRLKDTVTGEENIIECDGLFVSIGRKPTTDFLDNQIELDNKGYIVAGENTETSIPGVYAVGDVRTKLLRQIVTAVADGAMAVHMAEKYMDLTVAMSKPYLPC